MKIKPDLPRWSLPLMQPKRYKGACGGRGSGKSHFFAELMITRCIQKKSRCVCAREVQSSIKMSSKQTLEDKIRKFGVEDEFEIQQHRIINHRNGSTIDFIGIQNHTSASIKSYEGIDILWFEEAQSMSAKSLEDLRPTMRKEGAEMWFSWNPRYPTDPVEFLRNDPHPDTVCVEVNYYDNPWFENTSLKEEMEYDRSRDADKFAHVWLGQFEQNSEAKVFKNYTIQEFETPKDVMFKFGADWGGVDPTVLLRCWFEGRKLYVDYEAYKTSCAIDDLEPLFDTVPDSRVYPIIGDNTRQDLINHLNKLGFRIYPAIKGNNSVQVGIDWLNTHTIIIHPRCVNLIREINSYSYLVDPDTGLPTSKLKEKENHVIDALRYACEAVRRRRTHAQRVAAGEVSKAQPVKIAHHWRKI